MSDSLHVYLGYDKAGKPKQGLPVYPQPYRRIVKRLSRVLDAVRGAVDPSGDFDTEKFVVGLGDGLYEALTTFVPNLPEWLPEHEFNGYMTPQAWKEDRYDEEHDPSPSLPQFIQTFDTIIEVNGGKRLIDLLGKVFDPKMLRAEASLALSEWREKTTAAASLTGSQNSLGETEASPPNGSTLSNPTEDGQPSSVEDASPDFVPGPWVKAAA